MADVKFESQFCNFSSLPVNGTLPVGWHLDDFLLENGFLCDADFSTRGYRCLDGMTTNDPSIGKFAKSLSKFSTSDHCSNQF